MSGKNSKTVGAAVAAAPALVASQTAATAGEAGLPLVPSEATSSDEVPASEDPELEARRFTFFLETLPEDEFTQLLEKVLGEARSRGVITTDEPADEQEAEPADEHASVRELLQRHGLPRAWQDADGAIHFDETAALNAAGGDADSLTVIEA